MGEHKRNVTAIAKAKPQAVVTDVDEVGKILAAEQTFCDQCGAPFPLWPPDLLNEHLHDTHSAMFWPTVTEAWDAYKNDKDLARRQNYVTGIRVKFVFLVLQNRFDLYQKLVAAGVIVPPAQG